MGRRTDRTGNVNLTTGQILYAGHLPAGRSGWVGTLQQPGLLPAELPPDHAAHRICRISCNDRIVIRGGYGATSFYEGNSFNQRLTAITPFLQAAGFSVSAPTTTSVHHAQHRRAGLYRPRHFNPIRRFQQRLHRLSAEYPAGLCAGVESDARVCADPLRYAAGWIYRRTGPAH